MEVYQQVQRQIQQAKRILRILQRYVRNLYQESGNQIISGQVDIASLSGWKIEHHVSFVPIKPVCQFDQSLKIINISEYTPTKIT